MSKVLIISSSPRSSSNSDALCREFARGAEAAGHSVEIISLKGKKINFCNACYACLKGECVLHDDATEILRKMLTTDVIALGTPVYFYTMCGQLKTLIDRSVMFFPRIAGKKFYFMMTMADTEEANFKGTIEALNGFVACCENSEVKEIIAVPGLEHAGAIQSNPALKKAFEAGKNL